MDTTQKFNKTEKAQKLRNLVENGLAYKEVLNELISYYTQLEILGENFNGVSAQCLIFLLYISGKYTEANQKRSLYKVSCMSLIN